MLGQLIVGLVLVAMSCFWLAEGAWLSASLVAVGAALQFASSGGRVTVEGAELVLHATLRRDRRVRIAEIARIEPAVKDSFVRAPRMVLHSGEGIVLTPFLRPTPLRSRRWAAERLAEFLGLPTPDPFPVFRLGWFACAAMIAVGILFGVPLVIGGAAMIVGGGILSGALVFAVGAVLCTGAVYAVRAQRARRAADTNQPDQALRRT